MPTTMASTTPAANASFAALTASATRLADTIGARLDRSAAVDFVIAKTERNAAAFGDRLPHATAGGQYGFIDDGGWVGGFWNGLQYLAYELGGSPRLLDSARASWPRYFRRLHHDVGTLDHDVGFLFSPSFVASHQLTGEPVAREHALLAARLLANRFNVRGSFLQAWNVWVPGTPFSEENRGRIIVDSLYNVPLLFWAARESGDTSFAQVAAAHVDTCLRHLVRADDSTFHTFVFDPETGAPRRGCTHQGDADDSCWARGQAWAIGGFAHAHRYTREARYLDAACRCAVHFLDHLDATAVPPWDFRVCDPPRAPLDTSATSIAACGLLEIARHAPAPVAEACRRCADAMVHRVFVDHGTQHVPREEGLILHACGHMPARRDVDASLIYGDYFFAEAVARLLERTVVYW